MSLPRQFWSRRSAILPGPSGTPLPYGGLQRQKAVSAYLISKQILPFGFARHNGGLEIQKAVSTHLTSEEIPPLALHAISVEGGPSSSVHDYVILNTHPKYGFSFRNGYLYLSLRMAVFLR